MYEPASAAPPCSNCGRTIGRLEQVHRWAGHPVCAHCAALLASAPAAHGAVPPAGALSPANLGGARPPSPPPARPASTCAHCGSVTSPHELRDLNGTLVCPDCHPAPLSVPARAVPRAATFAPVIVSPPPPPQWAPVPPAGQRGAANALACAACGGAFGVSELVDQGDHVVCRACALAAATRTYRRSFRRQRSAGTVAAVAAGLLILGGVAAAIYLRSAGWSGTNATLPAPAGGRPGGPEGKADAGTAGGGTATARPDHARARTVPDRPQTAGGSATSKPAGGLFGGLSTERVWGDPSTQPAGPATPGQAGSGSGGGSAVAPGAVVTPGVVPWTTPASPSAVTTRPAAPATRPAAPLPPGLRVAVEAMRADRNADALAAFNELIRQRPLDPTGYHGAGVVLHRMDQAKRGRELLEVALTRSGGQPTRALVWNHAAAHFQDEPMRAVRVMRDHFSRPGVPDDEELLNAFGAALFHSKPEDRRTTFYADARALYFKKDAALQAKRENGTRRWGTQWISESLADRKWDTLTAAAKRADAMRVEFPRALKARQQAWDRIQDQRSSLGLVDESRVRAARAGYKSADASATKAKEELAAAERALQACEQPPFPKAMPFKPVVDEY